MRYNLSLPVLCLSLFAAGCGEETIEVQAPPATATAKTMLEQAAETGQPIGSGGMDIEQAIVEIRETDPAKADKMHVLYDELISTSNPAQVKAKAKELLAEMP